MDLLLKTSPARALTQAVLTDSVETKASRIAGESIPLAGESWLSDHPKQTTDGDMQGNAASKLNNFADLGPSTSMLARLQNWLATSLSGSSGMIDWTRKIDWSGSDVRRLKQQGGQDEWRDLVLRIVRRKLAAKSRDPKPPAHRAGGFASGGLGGADKNQAGGRASSAFGRKGKEAHDQDLGKHRDNRPLREGESHERVLGGAIEQSHFGSTALHLQLQQLDDDTDNVPDTVNVPDSVSLRDTVNVPDSVSLRDRVNDRENSRDSWNAIELLFERGTEAGSQGLGAMGADVSLGAAEDVVDWAEAWVEDLPEAQRRQLIETVDAQQSHVDLTEPARAPFLFPPSKRKPLSVCPVVLPLQLNALYAAIANGLNQTAWSLATTWSLQMYSSIEECSRCLRSGGNLPTVLTRWRTCDIGI